MNAEIPAYLLKPPYDAPMECVQGELAGAPPGALILVRPAPETTLDKIGTLLDAVQAEAPSCSMGLWLDRRTRTRAAHMAAHAG